MSGSQGMQKRPLRHWRRLARHGLWMLAAVLVMLILRTYAPRDALVTMADVGGNVLQTFGGMYGVIVAFAIFVTWQQHNDTQVAIEHEVVSLVELYRALGWFDSWSERDAVRADLHTYALAVRANNDPSRAASGARVDEAALLEDALKRFLDHAPSSAREERLFDSALEQFHELNEARARRETVSRLRLPEAMVWFVVLGGALCVTTVAALWVPSLWAHAALTCAMTWVVVAATATVLDLDEPFGGDFVVDWERLELAARTMERLPVADAGARANGTL